MEELIKPATTCHWDQSIRPIITACIEIDQSGLLPQKNQLIRPLPVTEINWFSLLSQRDYHCHSRDCKYTEIDKSTILLQKLVRDILRKSFSEFPLRYTTFAIYRQTVHSELGRIDQSQWQAVARSIDSSVVIRGSSIGRVTVIVSLW